MICFFWVLFQTASCRRPARRSDAQAVSRAAHGDAGLEELAQLLAVGDGDVAVDDVLAVRNGLVDRGLELLEVGSRTAASSRAACRPPRPRSRRAGPAPVRRMVGAGAGQTVAANVMPWKIAFAQPGSTSLAAPPLVDAATTVVPPRTWLSARRQGPPPSEPPDPLQRLFGQARVGGRTAASPLRGRPFLVDHDVGAPCAHPRHLSAAARPAPAAPAGGGRRPFGRAGHAPRPARGAGGSRDGRRATAAARRAVRRLRSGGPRRGARAGSGRAARSGWAGGGCRTAPRSSWMVPRGLPASADSLPMSVAVRITTQDRCGVCEISH